MLVRVMYENKKFDMVKPVIINELIFSGKLRKFLRSGGWVSVGIDPIRGIGGSYEGPERRKIAKYAIRYSFINRMKQSASGEQSLMKVADDYTYLTLMDGSNWHINPDDISIVCTWIPTTKIKLKFVDDGSIFPYQLTNIETNVSIRTMKIY